MRKTLALAAVGVLAFGAVACGSGESPAGSVKGPFVATVHVGPSTGLSVRGELVLEVDERGRAEGTVTQPDGRQIATSGQVDGRSVALVFDLGDGRRLYGTGVGTEDIVDTPGEFGGPLAGPEPGDLGDWGYALGG